MFTTLYNIFNLFILILFLNNFLNFNEILIVSMAIDFIFFINVLLFVIKNKD